MRRDMRTIATILEWASDNETSGKPSKFEPETLSDEQIREAVSYIVPMLIDNGFLRKIADQPDFGGVPCYHITWKGHCFLDLFELAENSPDSAVRVASIVAITGLR